MNSFIKTTKKCRKGFHHNKSSGTCSRTLKIDRDSHRLEKIIKSPAFKKKVKDLIEKPVPKEAFKEYFNGEMAGGDSVTSTDEKHILSKIKDNLMSIINAIKIRLLTGVPPNVPQELAEEIISSPTKELSIKSPASLSITPQTVKSSLTKSFNSIKSHLDDEVEDLYYEEYRENNDQHHISYYMDALHNATIVLLVITFVLGLSYTKIGYGNSGDHYIIDHLKKLDISGLMKNFKEFAGTLHITKYVNDIIKDIGMLGAKGKI